MMKKSQEFPGFVIRRQMWTSTALLDLEINVDLKYDGLCLLASEQSE